MELPQQSRSQMEFGNQGHVESAPSNSDIRSQASCGQGASGARAYAGYLLNPSFSFGTNTTEPAARDSGGYHRNLQRALMLVRTFSSRWAFQMQSKRTTAFANRLDNIWNPATFAAYRGTTMETEAIHPGAKGNDDELLLAKVAQGDRTAFIAIYDRFSTPLYSLAIKMLANQTEAEDLLQDVFLSVWNKAGTFRPERGSAFSWVVAQLRNRAIDKIRSRRRRGELLEANAPELEPTSSATPSSAQNAETSERAREVRSAMMQLSGEQQQVLRLAYFEGLTQSEIAEKLEEPLGTIKARAQRGMARMRTILKVIHE